MLKADPLRLQADLKQVYIRGNAELDLSDQEASAFIEELNRHLAQDQLKLRALDSLHWVLESERPMELETHPWQPHVGKPMANYLPKDPERYWERLFTEMQMILHASAVNQQRRREGKACVDALWFYSEPERTMTFFQKVWTCLNRKFDAKKAPKP